MEVKSLSNPPAGVKTVMEVSICVVILLALMCPCSYLHNMFVSDDQCAVLLGPSSSIVHVVPIQPCHQPPLNA